jgi:hypothetical protein
MTDSQNKQFGFLLDVNPGRVLEFYKNIYFFSKNLQGNQKALSSLQKMFEIILICELIQLDQDELDQQIDVSLKTRLLSKIYVSQQRSTERSALKAIADFPLSISQPEKKKILSFFKVSDPDDQQAFDEAINLFEESVIAEADDDFRLIAEINK